MGSSYVLMLTAFYVDNGRTLPLWKELPELAFWIVPSAVGVPLIIYSIRCFGTPWFWVSDARNGPLLAPRSHDPIC
jgi:hypothetical protein